MSAPRLHEFDYKGYIAYSVTICCDYKKKIFVKEDKISFCLEVLSDLAGKYGFKVYLYTFMPNHLHLCLVGNRENANLIKMINMFKQKTGFRYKKDFQETLWQSSYYDHVIRKEEGVENAVRYMLNNPVRKGLVKDYWEYPFSGSFVFDIKDLR